MNVRRDEQTMMRRNIRYWIKFGPAPQANSGPAEQEKRHVAAQFPSQIQQLLDRYLLFQEPRQCQKHAGRIARSSAQSAAHRNSFGQANSKLAFSAQCSQNKIGSFYNEIPRNIHVRL